MRIPCKWGGPDHEYPDNWILGGANGEDPRADLRWRPTTYYYYNDKLEIIHTTQAPVCDDQAIDEFTKVANFGPSFNPVWISASHRDEDGSLVVGTLPWTYDKTTDTATETRH